MESLQEDVGDECDEYECEDGVLFTVEAVVYVDVCSGVIESLVFIESLDVPSFKFGVSLF